MRRFSGYYYAKHAFNHSMDKYLRTKRKQEIKEKFIKGENKTDNNEADITSALICAIIFVIICAIFKSCVESM